MLLHQLNLVYSAFYHHSVNVFAQSQHLLVNMERTTLEDLHAIAEALGRQLVAAILSLFQSRKLKLKLHQLAEAQFLACASFERK